MEEKNTGPSFSIPLSLDEKSREETERRTPRDDKRVKVISLTSRVGFEAAVGGLRSLTLISRGHR